MVVRQQAGMVENHAPLFGSVRTGHCSKLYCVLVLALAHMHSMSRSNRLGLKHYVCVAHLYVLFTVVPACSLAPRPSPIHAKIIAMKFIASGKLVEGLVRDDT